MKTLFFPCTLDGLPRESGSRLWRAEWIARHWDGAAVFDGTQVMTGYQLFVFQKAYLSDYSQSVIQRIADWRERGNPVRIAFDLCDPDFIHDHHREKLLEALPLIDFATAPTPLLVDWLSQYVPAYLVPDGIAMEFVKEVHSFSHTPTPTILWAGYKGNVGAVNAIAQTMERLGVRGDILALEHPIAFQRFQAKVAQYDILLNPRPDGPPYCYKSNNKDLLAWASGVAVAHTGEELEKLLDSRYRLAHVLEGQCMVNEHYRVEHTVDAWISACVSEGFDGSSHD